MKYIAFTHRGFMKAEIIVLLFLISFISGNIVYAETALNPAEPPVKVSFEKDSTDKSFFDKYLSGESEFIGYIGHFNKAQDYHSVHFMRLNYKLGDSRFSVESSPFTLSMLRAGSKKHFSLNPVSLLVGGAFASNGSCLDTTILLPLFAIAAANMATNMEIDFGLDKNSMFNIMCGTTGDMYIINDMGQFKYTFYTGLSLFKPLNLKLFYTKNIVPFHSIKDDEMFGFSIMGEF